MRAAEKELRRIRLAKALPESTSALPDANYLDLMTDEDVDRHERGLRFQKALEILEAGPVWSDANHCDN